MRVVTCEFYAPGPESFLRSKTKETFLIDDEVSSVGFVAFVVL